MKKLLLTLAFIGVLSAAKPGQAQDAPTAPVALPAGVAAAPFVWQLRLKAGQKWLTTTETSTQTSQQMPVMPGMPRGAAPLQIETTAQTRTTTEQNVVSSDEKGARVEFIYRGITQNTKMRQGDKVVYDSATPTGAMKNMGEMLKAMTGARISYLVAPDGEISDVQGVEDYLNRMSQGIEKAFAGAPGAAAQQETQRKSMSAFLSPDTLKSSFGASNHAMPKTSVAPGETWKYSVTTPIMGTAFTQNGEATFVSRLNGVVTIAQKGSFSTDAGAEFKMPGAAPRTKNAPAPITQLDLQGTSSGEITVDENTGMTLSSHITQNLEGEIVMSGLTGKGSTLTIPMKMKAESTVKTEEVPATP